MCFGDWESHIASRLKLKSLVTLRDSYRLDLLTLDPWSWGKFKQSQLKLLNSLRWPLWKQIHQMQNDSNIRKVPFPVICPQVTQDSGPFTCGSAMQEAGLHPTKGRQPSHPLWQSCLKVLTAPPLIFCCWELTPGLRLTARDAGQAGAWKWMEMFLLSRFTLIPGSGKDSSWDQSARRRPQTDKTESLPRRCFRGDQTCHKQQQPPVWVWKTSCLRPRFEQAVVGS